MKTKAPTDPTVSGQSFDPRPEISISTLSGQVDAFTLGRLLERFLWLHRRWSLFEIMTPFNGVYPRRAKTGKTKSKRPRGATDSRTLTLDHVFGIRANFGATESSATRGPEHSVSGDEFSTSRYREFLVPERCQPSDSGRKQIEEALLPIYKSLDGIHKAMQDQREAVASQIRAVVENLPDKGEQFSTPTQISGWLNRVLAWPEADDERERDSYDALLDERANFAAGFEILGRIWSHLSHELDGILRKCGDRDFKRICKLGRKVEQGFCPSDQSASTRWQERSETLTDESLRQCRKLAKSTENSDLDSDQAAACSAEDVMHFVCCAIIELYTDIMKVDFADRCPSQRWLLDLRNMLKSQQLSSSTTGEYDSLSQAWDGKSRSDFVDSLSRLTRAIERQLGGDVEREALTAQRMTLRGPLGLVLDLQTYKLQRSGFDAEVQVTKGSLAEQLQKLMKENCPFAEKDNAKQKLISRLRELIEPLNIGVEIIGVQYCLCESEKKKNRDSRLSKRSRNRS